MLKHHLLLIYRNFTRYKSSFLINLIGLSAGLSCALLIYLWVNDEVQMDKFHENEIYQVMQNQITAASVLTTDGTVGVLGEALAREMPEVDQAVTTSPSYWLENTKIAAENHTPVKAAGKFASANFFKVFSYPLISGRADDVLHGKNKIVISERLAMKLFHTTAVQGKELNFKNAEIAKDNHVLISGVFKDIPANSSDQFDFLISIDVLFSISENYTKWGNYGPNTFVLLKKGADPELFNQKLYDFMKAKGQPNEKLFIRKYADGYLHNKYDNGKLSGGRIDYVNLFSLIAIFILIIACINFMNLSTAKASRRLKEVGIKKVMGARRESLIVQYMAESMILAFLALFISLLAVELLLPQFNTIVGKQLTLHFNFQAIGILLGIAIFTGLVSGSYPALYLSGLKPVNALKGRLNATPLASWARKGLVVFQFALSVLLIVAVLIVYKQIEYVQHKSIGYQKDNVLYFETEGRFKGNSEFAIDAIKQIPGVRHAAGIDREFLGDLKATFGDFSWEGRNPKEVIKFQKAEVSSGFIETMGMEMSAGRSFSSQLGADFDKIIINEAGIKVMQLKDPVGKLFKLWGKDYQIIGVVKDFNFESLHKSVSPMFMLYAPKTTNRIMVSMDAGKEKEVIQSLQRLNSTYNPGYSFDYKFLDQDFQAQYLAETRVALLSRYFAILAVVISCLGLFGLATFTAERRLKEIGIRKVLGASAWNVVYTLSRDFTRPVITAIVIALPISYLLARYWLNTFAYRIELQFWYFLVAGLLALFISLLTVFMQALKAAHVNPVQCLKTD
ncbi:ABC transporter permease [Pedobacter sp. MC2016-24]|uniref:ABC transporter permease n=1 Tax=Pedobacter sp. MC2016-24 TaxID=2780090 RepID=UPI001880B268|nr:ABC transporter permease [Pedobacter sp. MC2016-24]MBE9599657.1 ABC transporter permease [Pedobacter sp. MC2016-24]